MEISHLSVGDRGGSSRAGKAQAREAFTLGEKTQVMCAYERGLCGQAKGWQGEKVGGEAPEKSEELAAFSRNLAIFMPLLL